MILVTGASGLLGANLCLVAARPGPGGRRPSRTETPFRAEGASTETLDLDLCASAAVRELVEYARPPSRSIVHCAALTERRRVPRRPRPCVRRQRARDRPCWPGPPPASAPGWWPSPPTPCSTAKRVATPKTDPTSPVNVYAESKLAGERAVLEASADHLVVRTTLVRVERPAQAQLGRVGARPARRRRPRARLHRRRVRPPRGEPRSAAGSCSTWPRRTAPRGVVHLGSRRRREQVRLRSGRRPRSSATTPTASTATALADVRLSGATPGADRPRRLPRGSRSAGPPCYPTVHDGLLHMRALRRRRLAPAAPRGRLLTLTLSTHARPRHRPPH